MRVIRDRFALSISTAMALCKTVLALSTLAISIPSWGQFTYSADRLFLGDAIVGGAPVEKTLTVTNATISTYATPVFTLSATSGFTIAGGTCQATITLAGSASCTYVIRYTATTAAGVGYKGDQFYVAGTGYTYVTANAITGFGPLPTPSIASVNLGAVRLNEYATREVTITNSTSVTISINGFSAGAYWVSLDSYNCADVLLPGGKCSLSLRGVGSSSTAAAFSSNVHLHTSAGTLSIPVALSVVPTTSVSPFTVAGGEIMHGPVGAGYTFTRSYAVTNTSKASATITGTHFDQYYYADPLSLSGGTCVGSTPIVVPVNGSCTVEFSYLASQANYLVNRTLQIHSPQTNAAIPVSFYALDALRPPTLSPAASVDFGLHQLAASAATINRYAYAKLRVTNSSFNYTMRTLNTRWVGMVDSSRIVVDAYACTQTQQAPGESCEISFIFDLASDTRPIPTRAEFEIGTNLGLLRVPVSITLGTPVAGALSVSNIDFGVLAQGWSRTTPPLTIANTSASPVSVTSTSLLKITAPVEHFPLTSASRNGGTCAAGLPFTLAAGAACTMTFSVASDTASAFVGNYLYVNSSVGAARAEISGEAARGLSPLVIQDSDLNFGLNSFAPDASDSSASFSVFNPNWTPVKVHSSFNETTVKEPINGNGAIGLSTNTSCGYFYGGGISSITVQPGQTCRFFVTFNNYNAVKPWRYAGKIALDSEAGILEVPWAIAADNSNSTLAFDQVALDLGAALPGGSSYSRNVTLRNSGGSALTVTGGSPPSYFVRSGGDCPAYPFTLAAGAACNLGFAYQPRSSYAGESHSEVFQVRSTAGAATVTLSGQTVDGKRPPTVAPASINFGNIDREISATPVPVTLTLSFSEVGGLIRGAFLENAQGLPLYSSNGGEISLGGSCVAGGALPVGDCTLTVYYVGYLSFDGNLVLRTSSGFVRIPAKAVLGTKPISYLTNLPFKSQVIGTVSGAYITTVIFNSYGSNTIAAITSTNPAFIVSDGTCGPIPATLPTDSAQCTFEIRFRPSVVGVDTGEVRVTNAFGAATINISGTGINDSTPLRFTPSNVFSFSSRMYSADWAANSANRFPIQTYFDISNPSSGTLWASVDGARSVNTNWDYTPSKPAEFSAILRATIQGTCAGVGANGVNIAPNSICRIAVSAAPRSLGVNVTGTMQFDTAHGPVGVTLNAQGAHGLFDQSKAQFDTDGVGDILWQNPVSGRFAVWLMNGSSFKSGNTLGSPGPGWKTVGTGDFNRDGKADVLLYNETTGQTMIWLVDALVVSDSRVILNDGPAGWRPMAVGDLDDDGHADIVWYHPSAGGIAVWLMNGMNYREGQAIYYGGGPNDWKPVTTADLNGDGKSDLILHKEGTGETGVWFMNGLNWAGGGLLRWDVPGGWKPISSYRSNQTITKSALLWYNPATKSTEYSYYNGLAIESGQTLIYPSANSDFIPIRSIPSAGSVYPESTLFYSPSAYKTYIQDQYGYLYFILSEQDSGFRP